jgi:hypothetical protein
MKFTSVKPTVTVIMDVNRPFIFLLIKIWIN